MTDDRELDALLSEPLAEVFDRGFSARVTARIERRAAWLDSAMFWAPLAVAAVAIPFLPVQELSAAVQRISPEIAGSGALAFAAAIMALTLSLDRSLQERA
ncbi:MAG: hypothetical protein JO261_01455 [Alphaproteobacteria bacterium]|nr:hypothetical protein [Alphaproteobacteria bacterium]MBV9692343.1 hypothetical protein [Alphaproteobacteria bacterium]